MENRASVRRRWRSWIDQIDTHVMKPAYLDKAMFEVYVSMVETAKHIQTPGNFHDWVFRNYARSLLICVRKLADTSSQAVSLRRLLGAIANCPEVLTKRAFLGRYPSHHRDIALRNWIAYCGDISHTSLPRSVAHQDLQAVDQLARRVITVVNKEVVHHERGRRYRTLRLDEVHGALDELLKILAKYGDICGRPVPCPYDIHDASNWTQIFRRPWLDSSGA